MKILTLTSVSFCCICVAQSPASTGTATAQGPCSVANTGGSNKFTINCGIGNEQGLKMLAILNQILTRQLDPAVVMDKLDEIGKDVKSLKQGRSESYDFNGRKRIQTRPGRLNLEDGEVVEFQKIQQLYSEKNWKAMIVVCEREIAKVPEWLTPYMYAGVAYASLDQDAQGIKRLSHVVENAAGDKDYADAERILQILRERAK